MRYFYDTERSLFVNKLALILIFQMMILCYTIRPISINIR